MSEQLDQLSAQWDSENAYQAGADLSFAPSGGGGDGVDPATIAAGVSIVAGLMKSSSGGGASAPMKADGTQAIDQIFDFSGWNVATGGNGKITSDRQQLPALGGNWQTTALIIAAGLVAWKIYNQKSK